MLAHGDSHDRQLTVDKRVEQRKHAVRTALILGAVATVIYVVFIMSGVIGR